MSLIELLLGKQLPFLVIGLEAVILFIAIAVVIPGLLGHARVGSFINMATCLILIVVWIRFYLPIFKVRGDWP